MTNMRRGFKAPSILKLGTTQRSVSLMLGASQCRFGQSSVSETKSSNICQASYSLASFCAIRDAASTAYATTGGCEGRTRRSALVWNKLY